MSPPLRENYATPVEKRGILRINYRDFPRAKSSGTVTRLKRAKNVRGGGGGGGGSGPGPVRNVIRPRKLQFPRRGQE